MNGEWGVAEVRLVSTPIHLTLYPCYSFTVASELLKKINTIYLYCSLGYRNIVHLGLSEEIRASRVVYSRFKISKIRKANIQRNDF